MSAHKPLRQAMPKAAAFVDFAREVFGTAAVQTAIRNGMAGGSDFYACENGQRLGAALPPPGARFHPDKMQLDQGKPAAPAPHLSHQEFKP